MPFCPSSSRSLVLWWRVALCSVLPAVVLSEVVPSGIFVDNLVVQRDRPIPVWGTASAGETVTIAFAGEQITVATDAEGNFYGELPALPASAEPRPLTFTGNNTVAVQNVVVGDVWIASGQSNMAWRMERVFDVDLERLTARFPNLRQFRVGQATSDTPVETVKGEWVPATSEHLAKFTAVGYYFAREVHLAVDVPIGLVHSSWGGTPIEAWMSPAMIAESAPGVLERRARYVANDLPRLEAEYAVAMDEWRAARDAAKAAGQPFWKAEPRAPIGPNAPQRPAALFHGMIWPVRHLRAKGFIWYQGEGNVDRADEYRKLFPALITGWRELFGDPAMPFYWVQLAAYDYAWAREANHAAKLRAVQTETLALPHTGQAIATDVGDYDDIHPPNKLPVGRRLARLALARTYGFTELADGGPAYESHEIVAPANPGEPTKLVVTFAPGKRRLTHPDAVIGGFEIAGADKVFRPATATLKGNRIELVSPEVAEPLEVRYAWRNFAENARLTDEFGLPVPPFQTGQ